MKKIKEKILQLCATRPRTVAELAEATAVGEPFIRSILHNLRDAGITESLPSDKIGVKP